MQSLKTLKKVDESTGGMIDAIFCPEEEAYEKLNNGEMAGVIIIDPADGASPAASADHASMTEIFGADWDKMTDYSDIGQRLKNTSQTGTDWDSGTSGTQAAQGETAAPSKTLTTS